MLDYNLIMRDLLFEWNPWWNSKFQFDGIKRDALEEIIPWLNLLYGLFYCVIAPPSIPVSVGGERLYFFRHRE